MIAQTQPSADRLRTVADLPAGLVPRPRAATPATATTAPDGHVELLAAEIVSSAAVLTWVGRLVLLIALGLVAALVLVP